MEWEEVKDTKTLAKLKTVESMIPVALENQEDKPNARIWEREYKVIEECLQLDWTIEQWCMLAWISVQSYYKHRRENPDFARRMEIARQFPKMIARAAIQRRIRQWDAKTALDYLKLRDKFYQPDTVVDEWEKTKAPVVQFISVASNEWQNNTTSHDSQMNTKQESVWQWYLSSWEEEKLTPWENEEQALRNIDSLSFSNE
jgi:hypothetical protein